MTDEGFQCVQDVRRINQAYCACASGTVRLINFVRFGKIIGSFRKQMSVFQNGQNLSAALYIFPLYAVFFPYVRPCSSSVYRIANLNCL